MSGMSSPIWKKNQVAVLKKGAGNLALDRRQGARKDRRQGPGPIAAVACGQTGLRFFVTQLSSCKDTAGACGQTGAGQRLGLSALALRSKRIHEYRRHTYKVSRELASGNRGSR